MAQLGARFHGMEEVVSSNLTRSTKFLKDLRGFQHGPTCRIRATLEVVRVLRQGRFTPGALSLCRTAWQIHQLIEDGLDLRALTFGIGQRVEVRHVETPMPGRALRL